MWDEWKKEIQFWEKMGVIGKLKNIPVKGRALKPEDIPPEGWKRFITDKNSFWKEKESLDVLKRNMKKKVFSINIME